MSSDLIKQVVKEFLRKTGFVSHHLDSFALFTQTSLPEIIRETPPFEYENDEYAFTYSYENTFLHKPSTVEHDGSIVNVYPNECRLRNLLYGSPMFVQIRKQFTIKSTNETTETTENVYCGTIPVMVKSSQCHLFNATSEKLIESKECIYDKGGYFIVNGSEHVLVGSERMAANQVYVFSNSHDPEDIKAEIMSIEERARKPPSPFAVHLVTSNFFGKKSLFGKLDNYFKKEFPIGALFKLFGYEASIKEEVLKNGIFARLTGIKKRNLELLLDSIDEDSFHLDSIDTVKQYFTSIAVTVGSTEEKTESYLTSVFEKEFLPHVGIDETATQDKAKFVIYMIQHVLAAHFGLRDFGDHDHYKNKRTDVSGVLMTNIFKQSWNKLVKETAMHAKKKLDGGTKMAGITIAHFINSFSVTKDLSYVIATGNWNVVRTSKAKTGISQILNRFNSNAALSHCNRIINPMPKDSVLSKPRQQHNSSYGMICPYETPEGQGIGLVKNKTVSGYHISLGFSDIIILEWLEKHQEIHTECDSSTPWLILVNGKIIGWCKDDKPYLFLRRLKSQGILPSDVGIYYNANMHEISIVTDAGRNCRPLFVVNDNKILLKRSHIEQFASGSKDWNYLLKEGVVELVDVGEQETFMVCADIKKLGTDKNKYTHCEIHPSLLIGVCASIIPFANHDPAARIVYQSSMSKQALSVPGTNYNQRMDTMSHALEYPQKPLCPTDIMESTHFDELPAGQNMIVFISTYGGGNMEDGLIMSESAIQRGLGVSIFYRTYKDSEVKTAEREERFGIPNEHGADKLGEDGVVAPGTRVVDGDILIGKVCSDDSKARCIRVKNGEGGVVDQVLYSQNADGTKSVKIKIRQLRRPEIGDKFAATHSQKGVIGLTVPTQDLPFTEDGICPDVIFNPHSIPSRMTVGMLIEAFCGKKGAVTGKVENSTIFGERNIEMVEDELAKHGFQRQGWQKVYNGHTGEAMDALIYVGVCYYQRLKHMVADKWHARGSKGPINTLTRQPADGRSRDGGLRWGEMERDDLISFGVSALLLDRLMISSDTFFVDVCNECGLLSVVTIIIKNDEQVSICKACKSQNVGTIRIPYPTKLLVQEMYAMGVAMRFKTAQI